MSSMAKTLMRLIVAVTVLLLLVAAVPVAMLTYNNVSGNLRLSLYWVTSSPTLVTNLAAEPPTTQPPTTQPATVQPPTETPVQEVTVVVEKPSTVTPAGPTETTVVIPSITSTTPPTETETATETQVVTLVPPTITLTPSQPVVTEITYPFHIQDGTPVFIQNFAHADAGCSWFSVAGQVLDASGNPADNLVVSVTGTIADKTIDLLGITGSTDAYGPGGYEIQLGTTPLASQGTLSIQLLDLKGNPLSPKVAFNTSADCSQNVVLINFN